MCGRYTLAVDGTQLALQFQLPETPQLQPRYNIAPTQAVLAVRAGDAGRTATWLGWGLIPSWAGDPAIGSRMINARSETVAEKPAFRAAFRRRRCLIAADGFYEWQAQPGGKQPFFFRMRDGRPFAMAGLWEQWRDPDNEPVETCTILTTTANALLQPIHARMPVILDPGDYDLWLDPTLHDPRPLEALLQPYPEAAMEGFPVSKAVNRVANNGPELLERVTG
jgi:putative SOS response-associated peptidase YedK